MTTLTHEQFEEYIKDPLAADAKVRKWCDLPEDRYYTVSVWPMPGIVRPTNVHRPLPPKRSPSPIRVENY